MPRLKDYIGPLEGTAAKSIAALAETIQDLVYYCDAQGVPPETIRALNKAYRVLKPAAVFYLGEDDHCLVWDAPDTKFKPNAGTQPKRTRE